MTLSLLELLSEILLVLRRLAVWPASWKSEYRAQPARSGAQLGKDIIFIDYKTDQVSF